MYIRSQNRKLLIPIDNLVINVSKIDEIIASNTNIKNKDNEYYMLGTYESKNRAIDILNEIQKALEITYFDKIGFASCLPNYKNGIYNMPKV